MGRHHQCLPGTRLCVAAPRLCCQREWRRACGPLQREQGRREEHRRRGCRTTLPCCWRPVADQCDDYGCGRRCCSCAACTARHVAVCGPELIVFRKVYLWVPVNVQGPFYGHLEGGPQRLRGKETL